jgi:hypothetical protein
MAKTQRWQALPTQWELAEFEQFVLPHLSIGSRGPAPKLSLYRIFNWPAPLFAGGHSDGADAEGGVSPRAAPDRTVDRLGHLPAGPRSPGAGPYHAVAPSGRAGLARLPRVLGRPWPGNGAAPVHLLVGSTGLKLWGAGERLREKHGTKVRRSWRKLHIGMYAETGEIVAAELTTNDVDDTCQICPLLDQVAGPVASFTGDGG